MSKGKPRSEVLEALLAMFEMREKDIEEIESLLKEVDLKKLAVLLKELSDNADSILGLVELARELKESGTLAMLLGLLETSDETFNAIVRPEVMKALGNTMMLVYMLSNFDNFMLMKAAEMMPKCVNTAVEEASKTEKGLGFRELLSIMRSPEMAAALRGFIAVMRCMRGRT